MMQTAIGVAICAALASCAPQAAQDGGLAGDTASATATGETAMAQVHAVSGLRIIPVTVTDAKGTAHRFRAELAATPEEQARGLMFRAEMGPDEGMLFPSKTAEMRTFWMKNTPLPLDLIFIGADGRILNILQGQPYDLAQLPSAGPAIAVLELNAGRAEQLGIGPGDRVTW